MTTTQQATGAAPAFNRLLKAAVDARELMLEWSDDLAKIDVTQELVAAIEAAQVVQVAQSTDSEAAPADWDGKLPERLQSALNALRLECPPAVVSDVEHQVRSHYEALHTSLATTRRMFAVARDRLEAIDAAQPDPFAPAAPDTVPAASDCLVTLSLVVARDGAVTSDVQTHDNSWSDVAKGLAACVHETARVFREAEKCPYHPSKGNPKDLPVVRAARTQPVAAPLTDGGV